MLEKADEGEAALAEIYIEVGRGLWTLKKECKKEKKPFDDFLAEQFPGRSRSTLREYMTLAKGFDQADPDTRVQLAGLFNRGWGPVLGE
jgi:hypothetical protein